MTDEIPTIVATRWRRLKLKGFAMLFDVGDYIVLALGVVCIHLVRLGLAAVGVDQEFITPVHWIEIGANIYIFSTFFWRIIVRATREASGHE